MSLSCHRITRNSLIINILHATLRFQVYFAPPTFELPGATGGDGTLTYSIVPSLPAGLDFDPDTRILSGTPEEGTAVDAAPYTYTATDEDKDAVTLTLTITIQDDRVPTFDTSVPAQVYIEGVAIAPFRLPEAKNGNGTLSYSLTPPAGLRFDPDTRMLSGTPAEGSASAETDYTYTATDADKDAVALKFTITIQVDVMPTFGSSSVPAQFYQVGREIATLTLPRATDGNGSLTYSLTLPDGLSFDADGRTISGTPTTEAAAADYTLRVTDEDGDTDELVIRITVRASNFAPITLSPAATLEVAAGATSAVIELSSTVAWQATESETWIESIDPASGTNTSATITLGFVANPGAARTGKVIFTETVPSSPAVEVELTVTQLSSVFSEGLIPVSTFEQLNAMRYDMNTDGEVDDAANASDYAEAFPNVVYAAGKYTGYALTRNLDFNEATHYEDASNMTTWAKGAGTGMGWDPIGYSIDDDNQARFTGTFDGKGHTISHLFINRTTTQKYGTIGLFGYAAAATIQNLGVMDPEITGRSSGTYLYAGGIVGWISILDDNPTPGQLINCYVSGGSITTSLQLPRAGGIAGYCKGSVVSGCYASGVSISNSGQNARTGGIVGILNLSEISGGCYTSGVSITNSGGGAYAGGIAGFVRGSVVSGCSVSGGTLATDEGSASTVGGIVGSWFHKGGEISRCSVSDVTNKGGDDNGGIIGWWAFPESGESLSITACYVSGGSVKGARSRYSYAAGILSATSAPSSIRACYVLDVDISGRHDTGSIVGLNHGSSVSITACYAGGRDYTNVIARTSGELEVTNSYYEASGTSNTDDADKSVQAKTAAALQAPTAYGSAATDLYADWNIDLDDNSTNDDPWDFGTGSQYPVLKVIDANRDGRINAVDDVAAQRN